MKNHIHNIWRRKQEFHEKLKYCKYSVDPLLNFDLDAIDNDIGNLLKLLKNIKAANHKMDEIHGIMIDIDSIEKQIFGVVE